MLDNDVGAASVAIARNGKRVYLRAFGWSDAARTAPLTTDVVMRLASVSKPFTAAAVRKLIERGALSLTDQVFDLDGSGNGILRIEPHGEPAQQLNRITVEHLLLHRGGWDRDAPGVGDLTYRERQIAAAFGAPSPPGRELTTRFIIGQPLQFQPGSRRAYANFGYMLLGMIVEEVTQKSYLEFLKTEVLPRRRGWPQPELLAGRTFKADQDPREPHYDSDRLAKNVFFPAHSRLEKTPYPYGGWDHEMRVANGGLVANATTVLDFLGRYQVNGDDIGKPRPRPGRWRWNHTGNLEGTSTLARQRGDGIDYVVLLNKRPPDHTSWSAYADQLRKKIDAVFDQSPAAR